MFTAAADNAVLLLHRRRRRRRSQYGRAAVAAAYQRAGGRAGDLCATLATTPTDRPAAPAIAAAEGGGLHAAWLLCN